MSGGYLADLYDIVVPAAFRGDIGWYRRIARECGGPVLELGAGTGRVAIPLVNDGVAVHALDLDPAMLGILRRKVAELPAESRTRMTIVEDDMRTYRLTERFALIIAPFRALLHNLTDEDHLACFRNARAHLRAGGRLAFNVFHPSLEFMSQHAGAQAGVWRWSGTFPRGDGSYIVRSDANHYDTVQRRVHSMIRYEEYQPDGALHRALVHRLELSYLYPTDVTRLLHDAGFRSVQIWGGFDERALERDTDEMVVVAGFD